MTLLIIQNLGLIVAGLILNTLVRPISRKRISTRLRHASNLPPAPESHAPIRRDHLPDQPSLAGVPLRILLSERSGPGAMLRDTLMSRPPPRNH